jgi:hypothetical protein
MKISTIYKGFVEKFDMHMPGYAQNFLLPFDELQMDNGRGYERHRANAAFFAIAFRLAGESASCSRLPVLLAT